MKMFLVLRETQILAKIISKADIHNFHDLCKGSIFFCKFWPPLFVVYLSNRVSDILAKRTVTFLLNIFCQYPWKATMRWVLTIYVHADTDKQRLIRPLPEGGPF